MYRGPHAGCRHVSPDDVSVSRRELLGSVGSVGALGGASGLGSWALFGDRELLPTSMSAGAVDVDLDCDGCANAAGDSVTFAIDGLTPGDEGSERFTLTATANPVRVWLRTNCPEPVDPLGDAVEVRLARDPDCDGSAGAMPVYPGDGSWTTLNEFRTALRAGLRLDDRDGEPCLGGSLCVDLEYRLPADATWAADLATELTLGFATDQCRHAAEDAGSPFPPADCPESDCPDCVELGTVEVPNDRLVPGQTYGFEEADGYAIEVLTVTNKADDDGEETVCASFALLADGSEAAAPPLCRVDVFAAGDETVHEVEPTTRTRGELCSGPGDPGELPAISHFDVWVCSTDDGDDGDGCTACPTGDGSEGERIAQATFSYSGPDGATVTFDQRQSGNSPVEDVEVTGVDDGDTFTVALNGAGRPDFDVAVDGAALTVPAQSDPSALHTSCSQVFGVGLGLVDGDGTERLTVESAVDKNGEQLCEVSD